ncbi:hypothetical protein MCC01990_13720 [Bifidobacteriaceae bacterium MCC01990]|nr:hypothetical protein MCC01990_13720 [Bifidobacteriaceae bacterium MCC01990]
MAGRTYAIHLPATWTLPFPLLATLIAISVANDDWSDTLQAMRGITVPFYFEKLE